MAATTLPQELEPSRLRRRTAQVALLLAVIALVVVLAPGLGDVRDQLAGANGWWLAVAVLLEFLSGVSYVLLFRPIFCRRMSWRSSWELGWSELAAGSLVPASGASGLALGAWVLHRRGMDGARIARRSVAFFLIKSSVNFVAVAVLGTVMALGLVGPDLSPWLTAVPAALAVLAIAAVLTIPRFGPGPLPGPDDGRMRRAWLAVRRSVTGGVSEAVEIVRRRDLLVLVGAVGYWAFDNAVLYATFEAVGDAPPVSVVLFGYLIGQLGGLLPIPGGVGGIDGGLIGTLVVLGAPAATTAAAVFAYRLILFWLPLLVGTVAFASLRRALAEPTREDLCAERRSSASSARLRSSPPA
jgi:uncharacterized membrane protein YbhN (UPF0104 family)